MKRFLSLLLMLLLPSAAAMAEGAVLPGPGGLYGQGTFQGTETWDDGITYQVYQYPFEISCSEAITSLGFIYSRRLEKAGYAMERIEGMPADERQYHNTAWYALTRGGQTAYFRISGSLFGSASEGALYVPEGIEVDPNPKKSGSSSGSFQNPINYSDYVGPIIPSSSSDDLPDTSSDTVICEACHGMKECSICHGDGTWRNPYTGDELPCTSCDNGLCSVCDGTGVW